MHVAPRMLMVCMLWLGLSGCVMTVHSPLLGFTLDNDAESVVFGRLIVMWSDPSLIPMVEETVPMALTVKNEGSGEKYKIVCDKGGGDASFFARIPAGTYRLVQWQKNGHSLRLSGVFEAVGGGAVYVGTMTWSLSRTVTSFFMGMLFGSNSIGQLNVEDDSETSVREFQERYPQLVQQITKSIVHPAGQTP
jgi:hypothetical protein